MFFKSYFGHFSLQNASYIYKDIKVTQIFELLLKIIWELIFLLLPGIGLYKMHGLIKKME